MVNYGRTDFSMGNGKHAQLPRILPTPLPAYPLLNSRLVPPKHDTFVRYFQHSMDETIDGSMVIAITAT